MTLYANMLGNVTNLSGCKILPNQNLVKKIHKKEIKIFHRIQHRRPSNGYKSFQVGTHLPFQLNKAIAIIGYADIVYFRYRGFSGKLEIVIGRIIQPTQIGNTIFRVDFYCVRLAGLQSAQLHTEKKITRSLFLAFLFGLLTCFVFVVFMKLDRFYNKCSSVP